jgi:protoporphyrinogen/coproporphyrinogen III oxidase
VSAKPTVTVVGGGIAGLVAAHTLADRATVTVVEGSAAVGGKVATTSFRGRPLDRGPDAFITRNTAATDLCRALGIGDELIAPSAASAAIWARGRLRPFPRGLAIGIPTDPVALARSGIVSPLAALRCALDTVLPGRVPEHLVDEARAGVADPTVGELIGHRLGGAVLAALVDPLIGGINASDVDTLSFAAALPQLAPLVAGRRGISRALAPPPPGGTPNPTPVFYGLEEGIGSLPRALERRLASSGVTVSLSSPARALVRTSEQRWRLTTDRGVLESDGVIIAIPARAAGDLLEATSGPLAVDLRAVPYAGVVTVTLAWPFGAVPAVTAASLATITRRSGGESSGSAKVLPGSGVLVPRGQGHLITAATFTSTKWPRSANPGEIVVRASAGRHGDERALLLDDDALVAAVCRDLSEILGITAAPLEHRIERWPDSFPQYVSGHLARVERIRAAVTAIPGLALCGAAYDGIGIPACVESGAAAALLADTLSP